MNDILNMTEQKIIQEQQEVDKMVFPAYLKKDQAEYAVFYKIISRDSALRIDIGLTPIDFEGDIRRICTLYAEGKIQICDELEFRNAQEKAQDRVNKLLIKN